MKTTNILLLEKDISFSGYITKSLEKEGFSSETKNNLSDLNLDYLNSFSLIIINDSSLDQIINIGAKAPVLSFTNIYRQEDLLNKRYFIGIPFAFQDFIEKVKNIIYETAGVPDEIKIDTLEIDTKNKTVKRGDRNIVLTKKEFTLLQYLAQNKDKAISRSDLLEKVWNMQIDPFSNTVEAHVFSIRKKIDGGETVKLLHTIPKYGYRISVNK